MSILDTLHQNGCCTENNPDYSITYSDADKTKTVSVRAFCLESSMQHDEFGKIRLWKEHVRQTICLSWKKDVTKTRGCQECHARINSKKGEED